MLVFRFGVYVLRGGMGGMGGMGGSVCVRLSALLDDSILLPFWSSIVAVSCLLIASN